MLLENMAAMFFKQMRLVREGLCGTLFSVYCFSAHQQTRFASPTFKQGQSFLVSGDPFLSLSANANSTRVYQYYNFILLKSR